MDKMGWAISAKMMRRWFATIPGYAMPAEMRAGIGKDKIKIDYRNLPASQVEKSIITMQ
ncbi:hypothetical protein GN316_14030 [Xylophilus sp. Kf1]|nr:hypothetical protein [Xylophilus sp. Kf1]